MNRIQTSFIFELTKVCNRKQLIKWLWHTGITQKLTQIENQKKAFQKATQKVIQKATQKVTQKATQKATLKTTLKTTESSSDTSSSDSNDSDSTMATRQDLNIQPFICPSEPDEAALQWKKWFTGFERKLRFFKVTEVNDKLDALAIYGGETVEELIDVLPDPQDTDGETLNDYHKVTH